MIRPVLFAVLCPSLAVAAPTTLTHQGRVLGPSGGPISGTHTLTFTLYDTGGTARWTESMSLPLDDGYYSVVLGESVPLDDALVQDGASLDVAVDGASILPRTPLRPVPWAARAGALTRATTTFRGSELLTGGATADGVAASGATLVLTGGGYGNGTTDLVVNASNTPYILPPGVHEFRNVTVQAGAVLTTLPFNGYEGGKIEIRATGTVTIAGTVDVSGRGYRGGKAVNINPSDQWTPVAMQTGQPGESFTGYGNVFVPYDANGGGGGGGEVDNCSYAPGGGGGAYGSVGGDAPSASSIAAGPCRYGLQIWNNNADSTFATNGRAQLARGGRGGAIYGDAAITTLHLGSGGGGSGSDADCYKRRGGHGGDGGGAVGISARSIQITGTINASGKVGGNAVNEGGSTCSYGGNNGAGGGGAGGSIRLVGGTITSSGTLNVLGGASGTPGQGEFTGGTGGSGRIRLEATALSVTGTVSVGAGLRSDVTGATAGLGDGARGTWTSPLFDFSGRTGRFQQVDVFATQGAGTTIDARLCVGTTASDTLVLANCLPIAPSGAVDAADAKPYGRVRLVVTDRSPDRAFALHGVRAAYGP